MSMASQVGKIILQSGRKAAGLSLRLSYVSRKINHMKLDISHTTTYSITEIHN